MDGLSAELGLLAGISVKTGIKSDYVETIGMDGTTSAGDSVLEEVGTLAGAGLDVSTGTVAVAVARVGSGLGLRLGGGSVVSGRGVVSRSTGRCGSNVHGRL